MNDKERYFRYLDDLWEKLKGNMFGAVNFLRVEFGLGRKEAEEIFFDWKAKFDKEE